MNKRNQKWAQGEKLVAEIQMLKSLVGEVLKTRAKGSSLSKEDQTYAVISALTTLAADAELDRGGNEGSFNFLVKKSWDWVQTVYNMKATYDAMTREERDAVIAGKIKLNPDGTRPS